MNFWRHLDKDLRITTVSYALLGLANLACVIYYACQRDWGRAFAFLLWANICLIGALAARDNQRTRDEVHVAMARSRRGIMGVLEHYQEQNQDGGTNKN